MPQLLVPVCSMPQAFADLASMEADISSQLEAAKPQSLKLLQNRLQSHRSVSEQCIPLAELDGERASYCLSC